MKKLIILSIFFISSIYSQSIPSSPSGLLAIKDGTTKINLYWNDNSNNESGFKIERKTGSNGSWSQIATTGSNQSSFLDNNVQSGNTYYYRVRAYNSSGNSNYSNIASETTSQSIPQSPTGLVAIRDGYSIINLYWNDNSNNESGFKIERKIGANGSWSQITTIGSSINTYADGNLQQGTTYYYRVRAYNTAGNSNYSNEASETTPELTPVAPTGLVAIRDGYSIINLYWNDNSNNETGFKIEKKIGANGSWSQIITIGSNLNTYADGNLQQGTTYYYRVRAYNTAGNSNYSNEATEYIPELSPVAPTGLVATRDGYSIINLYWNDNSNNESGFKIERKIGANGTWGQITTIGSNLNTYADGNLQQGTTYYYRVRAYNTAGNSNYSNETTESIPELSPVTPTGLVAIKDGYSIINLYWNDNSSNESGFKIERKAGASGSWTQITITGSNQTTYVDGDLQQGTTYYYRVRAYNTAGNSNYSNEATEFIPLLIPDPPTNVNASDGTYLDKIHISWEAVSGASGYNVYRNTLNNDSTAIKIADIPSSSIEFYDVNVNQKITYYYWVKSAIIISGNVTLSNFSSPDTGWLKDVENASSIMPVTLDSLVTKGIDFVIEIKVGDPNTINDLYGISFKLSSDNNNCTYVDGSVEKGDFLGSSVLFFPQKVNSQTIDIAITKTQTPGVSGSGIIARAQFTSSNTISSDQAVTFTINDISANNSSGNNIQMDASTLTVTIKAVPTIDVWPGDCDNNGFSSASDIIPIGLYYGQSGPTQNNPGTNWQVYSRQPWSADGNTTQRIYADANGDGTINSSDVLAVGINYGKTHSTSSVVSFNRTRAEEKLNKTNSNPSIKISGPLTVKSSTKFTVEVQIGDPTEITDLYGISFKISSNAPSCTFVDNSGIEGSFFGNNILTFFQKIDAQTVDVAITKTSAPGINGNGTIATFNFISSSEQTVEFSLIDVKANNSQGEEIILDIIPYSITVGIDGINQLPKDFFLSQNYPNPFNPSTTIKYRLPVSSYVNLRIYDLVGHEIITLINEEKQPGSYEVKFDGTGLSSGVYFYKLQAGSFNQTKKFVLIK